MKTITLTGVPKSTNHIYNYTCKGQYPRAYLTPVGRDLKEQYYYEMKSQWKGKPLKSEVAVNIIFYFPDNKKRDIDNFNKAVIDSLNGIVLEDDKQITELHLFREIDKDNPRVEICVT